jgi:hypothetical protein
MTWTKLDPGAHVAMWCATEGCWGLPFHHLEVDGVGSNYCTRCRHDIEGRNKPLGFDDAEQGMSP